MAKAERQTGRPPEMTFADIGAVDVAVGIPTYNNARTIGHIVRAAGAGLSRAFPDLKTVLLISDGGSFDDTPKIAADSEAGAPVALQSHRVNPSDKISTPYHGIPGRGNAVQGILEAAGRMNARACAILDGDLWNLSPDWVGALLDPVVNGGYDYIAPFYRRHRYDGGITGCIVYPTTRSLFGKRIRQPIGGQVALSPGLVRTFLNAPVWDTDTAQYGLDIWMNASAASGNVRIGEVRLGAKRHDVRKSPADLSTMLVQIMGSLFAIMGESSESWKAIKGSEPVDLIGEPSDAALIPVRVDIDRMRKAFYLGLTEFLPVWRGILSGDVLEELRGLDAESGSGVDLPDGLWVRLIFDFALAANRKTMNPLHLLKSFTPLYLGKMASYIQETQSLDEKGAEDIVERLCREFESEKPRLVERWERPAG